MTFLFLEWYTPYHLAIHMAHNFRHVRNPHRGRKTVVRTVRPSAPPPWQR